jgi:hypothetical protein
MVKSKARLATVGIAAVALAAAISGYALAAIDRVAIGDLSNNEGILVDVNSFKIVKGKAKTDPSAQLIKLGAKPVTEGAIIFRSGDKLYVADGRPAGGPQAMNPSDSMPSTIDSFNQLFENF